MTTSEALHQALLNDDDERLAHALAAWLAPLDDEGIADVVVALALGFVARTTTASKPLLDAFRVGLLEGVETMCEVEPIEWARSMRPGQQQRGAAFLTSCVRHVRREMR